MSFEERGIPEEIRDLIILQLYYPGIIRFYSTTTLYYNIIRDDKLLDRDFPGIKDYFSREK